MTAGKSIAVLPHALRDRDELASAVRGTSSGSGH